MMHIVWWTNFIKRNSRLTERAPLDVIIKKDEGLQAVCNQFFSLFFAFIWTLCHIYCKDERLGVEGIVGSINLTQNLREGTLIIPSTENHPHQTQAAVHTHGDDDWMQEKDRRGVTGWLSRSATANTSSLIPQTWTQCLTVFCPVNVFIWHCLAE